MTDSKQLRKIIKDSGFKLKYLAERLGITPYAFSMKIDNVTEFRPSEISKLCEIIGIKSAEEKEKIFFANKGEN